MLILKIKDGQIFSFSGQNIFLKISLPNSLKDPGKLKRNIGTSKKVSGSENTTLVRLASQEALYVLGESFLSIWKSKCRSLRKFNGARLNPEQADKHQQSKQHTESTDYHFVLMHHFVLLYHFILLHNNLPDHLR